ncbi:MAG: hypothetical protein ACO1OQ_07805 [Rufibacter sp.]
MKRSIYFFLALVMGLAFSCSEEEVTFDPEAQGYAYYPLEVGSFRIYNVTQTEYANNEGETEEFQLREKIDALVKDQTGRDWYRVEVSRRPMGGTAWTILGVKMLSASSTDFRIQENNVTNVHLVFPVQNGKSWVHNAFVDQAKPANYSYEKVGEAFEVNGQTYDNTVVLVKVKGDETDLLKFNDHYEVLAKGVGPIYRASKDLYYCNDTNPNSPCQVGVGYIISGTDRVEELVETGKM